MFQAGALFGFILVISIVVLKCQSKYPSFKENAKLRNLAVSEGYVYIGGDRSIIKVESHFLNNSEHYQEDIYPINQMLKVKDNNYLVVCNNKENYLETQWWLYDIYGKKNQTRSYPKVYSSSIKSITTKQTLLFGSQSCIQFEGNDCVGIASLQLDEFMKPSKTYISVDYIKREDNKYADFSALMQYGMFIYFLYTKDNFSKLGKLCGRTNENEKKNCDKAFCNSFEDTPIQCTHGNRNFTVAVDGFIWKNKLFVAYADGSENIICKYGLEDVADTFMQSRKERLDCSNINTMKNQLFKLQRLRGWCYNKSMKICQGNNQSRSCEEVTGDFCNAQYFGSVEGRIPITSHQVVYSYTSPKRESIVKLGIQDHGTYAVMFVGTSFGGVRKVFMTDYADKGMSLGHLLVVQPTYPVVDIQVYEEDVFVMTENRVVNIAEKDPCPNTTICTQCMTSNNPKCGWNILAGSCSRYIEGDFFLPSVGRKCLEIRSEEQLVEGETENVIFHFYPPVINSTEELHCKKRFDNITGKEHHVTKTEEKFSCQVNGINGSATSIQLDILKGSKTIASGRVNLYRCPNITSCEACVKNRKCYWCFKVFSCHKSAVDSGKSEEIKPLDDGTCPRITKSEVLIPNGKKESVKLSVKNITIIKEIGEGNLTCMVKDISYSVKIEEDTVVCEDVQGPPNEASISIKYKQIESRGLDGSATLKVYTCRNFDTCGLCKYKARNGYNCVWSDKVCEYYEGAGDKKTGANGKKNNNRNKCKDDLSIKSLFPESGPILGGTKITIKGTNLGYEGDIINITIGDVPCNNVTVQENSKRITCITGDSSNKSLEVDNPVEVKIKVGDADYDNNKGKTFTFTYKKNHLLTEFKPKKAIMAGGRKIKLEGKNINFKGSTYEIKFCDGINKDSCLQCLNPQSQGNGKNAGIMCDIGKASSKMTYTYLFVTIDDKTHLDLNCTFSVVDNPKVKTPEERIQIFKSGGSKFNISGNGFSDVDIIKVENVDEKCRLNSNGNTATCEAPPYTPSIFDQRRKRSTGQNIKLQFDNFNTILVVYYTADPKFEYKDTVEYQVDTPLVIEGTHLLEGAHTEDYVINVGLDGRCSITEPMTDTNITCLPPKGVPRTNYSNKDIVYIIVQVGRLKFHVGDLKYIQELNLLAILVGTLAAVVVLTLVLGALYVLRIKKKKDLAEKDFEMKLSTIEERIRETSREEFADAQMTIKDIKSDLVTSRVPYLDYQSYVFNQLFPNLDMETHPLLHEPMITDDNKKRVEQAMDIFSKLLTNKLFLKFLVKTFDSHVKGLSMQDKAQFSSLLSVAVIGNMRLFYQLISCLLEDMIKSANKKQQKLLFRRFESITQRLTVNWLVMTLHDHLQTYGGMQLFMLYKATQTVIEKGPIDAVNINCKYTLAEERLLKTRVDCEPMRLNIDLNGNSEVKIPVEVLDCDTITQVKRKCCSAIYKNKPSSEIPSTDDLELEWHSGKGGKLTLQDVDNISDRGNGMLRLNTLKHYLVKDGSEMALVYKDNTDEMYVNQIIYMRQHMENYGQSGSPHSTSPDNIKLLMLPESTDNPDRHKWHLSNLTDEEKCNKEHEIGEIFLNRLFHTKLILKDYIDAAFEGIMDPQSLSIPVRYFLCMLDKYGKDVGVDSDVLQSWKSECYATRVWASLIAKPQLLFDVDVPSHVEPSMDILNQVFIDSFTQNPQHVTKEASSQKLLFCKDIPIYRKHVNSFFLKVEPVTDQQFWKVLHDISNVQTHELKFSRQAVLHQLFKFISKYKDQILDAFEDEDDSKNLDFANKLEKVAELMED